ncbi:hypothetical protein [Pseudoalteromonas luteoviolacea]|uniref:hypothetical protein n=1 Tax=Pseudoalteromonas luteoviolacea TaxID=43657 RepID=UPI001150DB28|nr:hypothetical protein [Pseudoalteromonas luteoviolacea]TQF69585.1 hypothetical protein FLM44_00260 [Pseudoalteromonas luteoviolacea]
MKLKRNAAVMIITCALASVVVASCNPVEVEPAPQILGKNGLPALRPISPDSTFMERYINVEESKRVQEGPYK